MKIRKLKKSDIPVLKRYWKVSKPFEKRYELQIKKKITFLVVWLKNKPIGHGTVKWQRIPIIEDMYTDPKQRSKGIGSELLKHMENLIKKRCKKVCLYVAPKNKHAQKLYIKKGYKLTGKIKNKEKQMIKSLLYL